MNYLALSDIDLREPFPGYRGRFVHSATMSVAHWEIDGGSPLPEHSHPHEQIVNVIDGSYELVVDGEARMLGPGSVVVIPGGVPHSGRSVTDCRIIDVFHPARDDYR